MLQSATFFTSENYDTLVTKSAQYSAKLVQKPDQARAVYLVSHLFWKANLREARRTIECLQRSIKIADACIEANVIVQLFVEILNRYLYYFECEPQNDAVTVKYLSGLVALVKTNMANVDSSDPSSAAAIAYFNNTLAHMTALRASGNARYATLEISSTAGAAANSSE